MSTPEQAQAIQLRNIEAKTGFSLEVLTAAVATSGKVKHGEVRAWLMDTYGLGYGSANGLATDALTPAASIDGSLDPLDEIYSGKKAHLRPCHEAVMAAGESFGEFEIAPKKGSAALRRKKQFAMVGPKSANSIEIGINLKAEVTSERIVAQKPGGMCQHAVRVSSAHDVDQEVVSAMKEAFDAAG